MTRWCAVAVTLSTAIVTIASGCARRDEHAVAVRQVHRANQYYADYILHSDLRQLVDAYEHDAVLLPPDRPPLEGPDAIRTYWAAYFAEWQIVEVESAVDDVLVMGIDWAYSRGHFTRTLRRRRDGEARVERGQFTGIWKRHGGGRGWRLARDQWLVTPPDAAAPDP